MIVKNARTVGVVYHHSTLHAMEVVNRVWWAEVGQHARVTGLAEEGHSEGSKHYGLKTDIRCMAFDVDADEEHLPPNKQAVVNREIRRRLGANEYNILWESMRTVNAHLHISVRPR